MPSGEFKVINALTELGFKEDEFIHDSSFELLTDYCTKQLRFDIRLIFHKVIFEVNGRQHYEPVTFGGISEEEALANFILQQEHDKIKMEFCEKYGYKLIIILYEDLPNIVSKLRYELADILKKD